MFNLSGDNKNSYSEIHQQPVDSVDFDDSYPVAREYIGNVSIFYWYSVV